mmetsp:Transcript_17258/g.36262  ORF Transcript_17258/g.36262 Transcript_17258/m.36262 type:complete len:155 (+) Transcript_17258:331-795(+)
MMGDAIGERVGEVRSMADVAVDVVVFVVPQTMRGVVERMGDRSSDDGELFIMIGLGTLLPTPGAMGVFERSLSNADNDDATAAGTYEGDITGLEGIIVFDAASGTEEDAAANGLGVIVVLLVLVPLVNLLSRSMILRLVLFALQKMQVEEVTDS